MKINIFWDIICVVSWKSIDVSKENVGPILRIEE
jgi:hypothetical protein